MEKQNIREQLITKSPRELLIQLSLPAIIGMTVIGLYPLMDGIFAGNIIGQDAMTACSVAAPLTFINNGVATLLGVGSASILSRAMGKNDKDTVDKIMGNLVFWVIAFSLIITAFGILFAPKFLDLIGASGNIKSLGIRYVRVLFIGSIFVNFTQSANMVMRGEGEMKKAMAIMGFGALLNIILDPIFMTAMGDRGIEGGAIATVISQFIQAGITLFYFKRKSKVVKIHKIEPDKIIQKEMFSIGVSAMMMQVLFMIQQTILYKMAFKYGGNSNGILMAASLRIYGFSFIPLWGMSQGLQPVVGTNYGANKIQRAKDAMKTFSVGGTILAGIFWIPTLIFSKEILSLFGVERDIIEGGIDNFRIFFFPFILCGIMVMTITFFQSIGNAKKAGIIVMFRQLILFVPFMIIIPIICGLNGVWIAQPIVDTTMVIAGVIMINREFKNMDKIHKIQ